MTDNIPALKIETQADGCIRLEQPDGAGHSGRVVLHPVHLRLLAETARLTHQADRQALTTITMLERRLSLLRDRIGHLADWLENHSDHDHADLSYETTLARAAADFADEFCEYFTAPPEASRAGQPAKASAAGQTTPPSTASAALKPEGQQAKPQRADEPQLFALADPAHGDASQPA